MNEIKEIVPEALDGERLDRVVAFLADISRSRSSNLILNGEVRVDGITVKRSSQKVVSGNEIFLRIPRSDIEFEVKPDPSVSFDILHSEKNFIVVDKPAGLVVHPGAGNHSGTLINGLLAFDPSIKEVGSKLRPGIVHRLDKDTSGLLVVARTPMMYDFLLEEMLERKIERRYLALVWGSLEGAEGVIDAPIARSLKDRTKMAINSKGKPARTFYNVIQKFDYPPLSLLDLKLESGRTHQIRVHLTSIGNPVLGDKSYGKNRPDYGLSRHFLHANKLSFKDFESRKLLSFESSLPSDLRDVIMNIESKNF